MLGWNCFKQTAALHHIQHIVLTRARRTSIGLGELIVEFFDSDNGRCVNTIHRFTIKHDHLWEGSACSDGLAYSYNKIVGIGKE